MYEKLNLYLGGVLPNLLYGAKHPHGWGTMPPQSERLIYFKQLQQNRSTDRVFT